MKKLFWKLRFAYYLYGRTTLLFDSCMCKAVAILETAPEQINKNPEATARKWLAYAKI